ncbi:WbjF [Cellvibrio sp. BR]|uniref:NAD-dependent epimerase/dehydratase family protein n=1 Tax=Cellvibrio sp. BR TaxID=1134474 RepID=UPI000260127D|nr:NAD-dependent epimerase/dehydratase family protein [Cellvibrio sp. BR]EIK46676.1 WbjF [Cellvibrio sp. BR]
MPTQKKNMIITGASGFIGRHLVYELLKNGENYKIFAVVRKPTFTDADVHEIIINDIDDITWIESFPEEIDCIIHTAGLAHNKLTDRRKKLEHFRKINTICTQRLAEAAIKKGAKRFIFLSSVGVLGASTKSNPFNDFSPVLPFSEYAISKREAEIEITRLCTNTSMDYVIIRPPLVYGFDAPGNFASLLRLIHTGIPLPLGLVNNKKTFISCSNLASFIVCCANNPLASNQIFLIADDQNISTPELVKVLALGMGIKPLLLPIPIFWIKTICTLGRKLNTYEQLCCSLEIDSTRAKQLLQWTPPTNTIDGLIRAASEYNKSLPSNI